MLRAFHKFQRLQTPDQWENYKQLSKDYHKGLDDAETLYKSSLCDSLSTSKNTRRWWSTVKWLLGKGKDSAFSPLIVNKEQITDNKKKADEFNKFFLSHTNIDDSNASLPDDNDFPSGLGNIIAKEGEVYDILRCLDTTKATGPDGISP